MRPRVLPYAIFAHAYTLLYTIKYTERIIRSVLFTFFSNCTVRAIGYVRWIYTVGVCIASDSKPAGDRLLCGSPLCHDVRQCATRHAFPTSVSLQA